VLREDSECVSFGLGYEIQGDRAFNDWLLEAMRHQNTVVTWVAVYTGMAAGFAFLLGLFVGLGL